MNQQNTLATNESDLVAVSVAGAVAHPAFQVFPPNHIGSPRTAPPSCSLRMGESSTMCP